ncbi:MAG: hypothetical protein KC731_38665, partial [Myxococcales bacterium]|nr:hypothetical protein [Myxococcales bacterium]
AVATSPRMELVHSRPSADEPVETHETAVAPEEESPISASRSGSFPSIHDDCPPEPSTPMPLSAARIAVMPDERGRPQVQFLPFGQAAPEGAVTAMLVTTNAHEAARLAEMIARATEQDLRSAGT